MPVKERSEFQITIRSISSRLIASAVLLFRCVVLVLSWLATIADPKAFSSLVWGGCDDSPLAAVNGNRHEAGPMPASSLPVLSGLNVDLGADHLCPGVSEEERETGVGVDRLVDAGSV